MPTRAAITGGVDREREGRGVTGVRVGGLENVPSCTAGVRETKALLERRRQLRRALCAAGMQGKGSHKRSCTSQTPVSAAKQNQLNDQGTAEVYMSHCTWCVVVDHNMSAPPNKGFVPILFLLNAATACTPLHVHLCLQPRMLYPYLVDQKYT